MDLTRPSQNSAQPLNSDEIHVWHVGLAQPGLSEQTLRTLLSAEEQETADRFRFAADRRRFIIRRAVRRSLLARYLDRPAQGVSFCSGRHGKPGLDPTIDLADLRFNCSHSRDHALLALTRGREIGIDVAWHDPALSPQELLPTVFSPHEQLALAQQPPALQAQAFFNAWTRKEAYVKAIGLGLSFPLDRFSVSLSPDHPALLEVTTDPREVSRWTLAQLEVGPDYSATVAYEAPTVPIRQFTWHPTGLPL